MKKLILIDGNALVHRAFHALPPLTSPSGIVVNAVFGFNSILIKTVKDLKPDYIAAAFDLAGPTFRHEEFAEYKVHRERAPDELYAQIPLVKNTLEAFGIPIYEKPGYEADDLIGTLATKAKTEKDLQVIIATGDLDTLQLVDGKKVVVFTLRKGVNDTVTYDEEAVKTRYNLSPHQLNDYRGLKGDPSDNIPGVPGIGEKTASELIKKFGGLEKLYKVLENKKLLAKEKISPKMIEKLVQNKEQAFFSKHLSTVVTDLEVDFSLAKIEWKKNADLAKIEKVFRDFGFASLLKRLPEIGLSAQASLGQPPAIQENLNFQQGPTQKKKEDFDPDAKNLYVTDINNENMLKKIWTNSDLALIGYDLKHLFRLLIGQGIHIKNTVFDIKIAAYLLSPDRKDYDFSEIYYEEFKEVPSEDPELKSAYFWKLKNRLWGKMRSSNLLKVFEDIEMPLIKVLAEMEFAGIKIDTESLTELLKSTSKELAILEKKIYKFADGEFNINSPQQLSEILFSRLNIKGRVRKTGGGALSTAAPELEKLREEHPIIDLVLQYRELQKLKTTYIEPFPHLVDKKDKRLHTTYNQTGTATGRLASQEPNLQNIPTKTELGQEFRKAFIAENGYQLVSFDYSQIELRIVAHIAKDEKMIGVFRGGEDIHTATAAEIFEVKPDKVTKEMRNQAKVLNFGIIYGMGPLGFARAAGVTTQRAREFITKYFADFAGVARYMEEIKGKAHKNGYVETIMGRRRSLPEIYSTIPQLQSQAERMAINHPIQGTAADLIKIAMIKVYDFIHRESNDNDVKLLLQVHDELVFEIKNELVQKLAPKLKQIMEQVYKLDVPLIVDVKFGDNWQKVEPMDHLRGDGTL